MAGKDTIAAFLTTQAARTQLRFDAFESTVIHETGDPDTVVVEFDLLATNTTTTARQRRTFVRIFRVRDNKIVLWRDYWDPRLRQEAT